MISQHFNKWTLNFHYKEYEAQYEEQQSKYRIFCFQLLTISIAILALICLIIFIVQQQPLILISFLSALTVIIFILFMLSRLLQKYLRLVFAICFIMIVGCGITIARSGMEIPQFTYGYSVSTLAIFLFQHIDNRIKIILIFAPPLALLIAFEIYTFSNLQFICFAFTSSVQMAITVYTNEYNSRLAFSLNLIVEEQKNIIHEFVKEALFAVSLNGRTRQFELEFNNQKAEEQHCIHTTVGMKEFLRNSYVIKNQIDISKSPAIQITKINEKIYNTLEEYLFSFIKTDQGSIKQDEDNNIEILSKQEKKITSHQIYLKKANYGKPILILLLKSNYVPLLIEKYEQRLLSYKNAITFQSQQIGNASQTLFCEIMRLKKMNFHIDTSQSLKTVKCLSLSMINLVKNYIIYFQQDKLSTLSQDISIFCLQDLIEALYEFFTTIAEKHSRVFTLSNFADSNVILKTNIKFLTQILINIFEQIIAESLIQSKISLVIRREFNLNPEDEKDRENLNENNFIAFSPSISQQQLIQFVFSFKSTNIAQIKPLEFEEIFLNNSLLDSNNKGQVTNLLLQFIGPYNHIQTKYMQIVDNQDQYYINTIYFYVYTDQSLLDKSYINKQGKRP